MLTRPLLRRTEPSWGSRVPWLAGLVAAGWSLVAGLALTTLPGLLVWISDGADGPATGPLRLGGTVWLAAHRAPLDVDGVGLQVAPGGLSVLLVLLLYRAGRWSAHVAATDGPAGTSIAATVVPAVAGYGLAGGLIAMAVDTDQVSASPALAVGWTIAVSVGAIVAGALREAGLVRVALAQLPAWGRVVLAGAAAVVVALLAAGAVLVAISAIVHSSQTGVLVSALDPDPAGAVLLGLLTAAGALNAVVWGAAYALGPGFALGIDTSVAPSAVELGPMPVFPLLGALPTGPLGTLAWLVLAGPVAAGVLAGVLVQRRLPDLPESFDMSRRDRSVGLEPGDRHGGPGSLDQLGFLGVLGRPAVVRRLYAAGLGLVAGALAGVVMSVLALVSGGSAGTDRLAVIGPVPWQIALATLVVAGIPAAVTAAALPGGAASPPPTSPHAAGIVADRVR